jgi:hypothetical protein
MTFYLNGSNRNFQVQINRMDREHEDLKKDYEKLYAAYYSYDKKIAAILKFSDHIFWDKDSAGYLINNKEQYLFAFYKKPRMVNPCYAFWYQEQWPTDHYPAISYNNLGRMDTLKPHEFILLGQPPNDAKAFDIIDTTTGKSVCIIPLQ